MIGDTDLERHAAGLTPPRVVSRRRARAKTSGSVTRGRRLTPWLLLIPAAALYGLFTVYPIYRQFDYSFYHLMPLPGEAAPFIGWSNYSAIFKTPEIPTAALNTLLYVVITIPVQMALGLFAAAVLTDRLPGSTLWRALVFIPVVTSWVVVSYLFAYMFSPQGGLVDVVLGFFAGHPVHFDWLAYTWTTNTIIWLLGIWKGFGWSFIIFLAALDGVPRDMIEAARIDGAHEARIWRTMIIPAIRSSLVFVLVILVIGAATVFTSVLLINKGGPYDSTTVLYTWAYAEAFSNFQFGYAAAIASLLAVVLFILSVAQIRVLMPKRS